LKKLYDVYCSKDAAFKAAETLEEINEKFPWNHDYNQIGLHYDSAGQHSIAIKFYERAYDYNPKPYTAFNLGISLKYSDENRYIELMRKALNLDPNFPHALFELGKYKRSHQEEDEGLKMIESAFEIWKSKYESGNLGSSEYGWLSSCSRELGRHSFANEVANSQPRRKIEKGYNTENLASNDTENEKLI
jgi:molecular chaperone DnaK